MDQVSFVRNIGWIFEHSPWVAEKAWELRPYADREDLLAKMKAVVLDSAADRQMALIQSHPDLAGRLARMGKLTKASKQEQKSAGLDLLKPTEMAEMDTFNIAYKEKFGFPFIICARLNSAAMILEAFGRRLRHDRQTEINTALEEIGKIARLRLEDALTED
jgi:2-oxo-4-hydroxy-4-carboxy-5-ureidoimidazoline decarboxylase